MPRTVHTLSTVAAGAALALGGASIIALPASATTPGTTIVRQATLTAHFTGLPSTPDGGRQIASAAVGHDLRTGTLSAAVTLKSFPSGGGYADLLVGFGVMSASGDCIADPAGIIRGSTERFTGGPLTFSATRPEAVNAAWTCAAAFSVPVGSSSEPYDGVVGPLSNVAATPKLSIARSEAQVLKRKTWTAVRVTVTNTGTATSRSVKVSGKKSGVKVKTRSFGSIAPGASATRTVKVRLDASSARSVSLRVSGVKSSSASRSITLHPLKKPAAGRWKGRTADGRVSFTVTKGTPRIKGWSGVLTTNCVGGPGGTATYSFPTTKITKNGTVKRTQKLARGGSITLYAKVTGRKVVEGRVGYNGPSSCGGSSAWTAKR